MKGSGRISDRGSSVIGGHRGGRGAGRGRGRGRMTKTPCEERAVTRINDITV